MADNSIELLEQQKGEILQSLPSWITPERWWALAIQVARYPSLQRCTRESLVESIRQIASWGLELDGEEAVVIAYGTQATPTAMTKGLIRRVIESGAAVHLYSELICQGESIRITSGTTGRNIEHDLGFGARGKVIGAYAVAILNGGITDFELFSSEDIEAIRHAALRISGGKPSPAWQNFPGEMIKKSVLRRLCKRLRGKRDTEAGQRYADLMEGMKRADPEPTAPLGADEMPRAVEPEPVKGADKVPAAKEAVKQHGDAPALIDNEQMKLIDENTLSTSIQPKRYMQLMKEFGIKDEHDLTAAQLPKFLERMHELASTNA